MRRSIHTPVPHRYHEIRSMNSQFYRKEQLSFAHTYQNLRFKLATISSFDVPPLRQAMVSQLSKSLNDRAGTCLVQQDDQRIGTFNVQSSVLFSEHKMCHEFVEKEIRLIS